MEDGFYAVKNGEVFKIDPRIKMPIAKSVNVKTGEIHYPSNADRIRAMTDEELAEFFAQQEYRKPGFDGWLPLCNHVMGPRTCHENGCKKCWLDWLQQEVE